MVPRDSKSDLPLSFDRAFEIIGKMMVALCPLCSGTFSLSAIKGWEEEEVGKAVRLQGQAASSCGLR